MEKDFDRTRQQGERFYKNIVSVRCPYLGIDVHFNARGLEHLKFKKKNFARSVRDQRMRFKLLRLAPEILKLSKTVQGISERKIFEHNRSNHRNEYLLVDAIFYEFIAVLDAVRVKVIVRKIGSAPAHFWSVIPFWKTHRDSFKRKLYSGNPEED